MDENIFLQGYWQYAFSSVSRVYDSDSKDALVQVYEADISPAGSAHDRACELWQQIVGIERIKKVAEDLKLSVAEVVYGSEHVKKHHKNAD